VLAAVDGVVRVDDRDVLARAAVDDIGASVATGDEVRVLSAVQRVRAAVAAAYAALGRAQESQAEQALYDRAKENRVRARGPGR
jgi:hypothetical protein